MSSVIAKPGQTLVDLCIQELGSEEALFAFAQLNELSVTSNIAAGQELKLPEIEDKRVARFFEQEQIFPATFNGLQTLLEGIDYWAIEFDFVVS